MAEGCCGCAATFDGRSVAYRRVLLLVIVMNAVMFVVELAAGYLARSQALQADALDFLGDAATYSITLLVIGRPVAWRAKAAVFKGLSLGALALWVAGSTVWRAFQGGTPELMTMSVIGVLALCVNVSAAALLYRFRDGDANVRSAWLCSRNDAIGNVAVVFAAAGVWATGDSWPDLVVALAMSTLFVHSSIRIVRQARGELGQVESHQTRAAQPLEADSIVDRA
jgi:Co/Zn/Cd efflux system component